MVDAGLTLARVTFPAMTFCKVSVMKIIGLAAAVALAFAAGAASAQNRYSIPPAAALSADLASPWLLQLRNKPNGNGVYRVELARPQAVVVPMMREPQYTQIRAGISLDNRAAAEPRKKTKAEAQFDPQYEMQIVPYDGPHQTGTIIIDTEARFLYLVEDEGMARRYGIGVGRPGFEWAGAHNISEMREWPDWNPPAQMIAREARRGKILPKHMAGGPENPLGARAMYLGSSLYRIHGTNQPWSIGQAVSSGCIRMRNEDVIDLYERVGVGTRVIVS
jgi:lipoprotein-anchoring transpeptidase ErfK/SrfK